MACEENFIEELHKRGFRLTPQREMVLSAMHEIEGLASADEIYGHVRERSAAVDISTVYRTLDLLQEIEMVACVDPGDGQHRYELLGVHGPHIHLICQSCSSVTGIEPEKGQPLADRLLAEQGFVVDLGQLTVRGLCRACAAARTERASSQAVD
jgi:Fur family ferric uptake transcriptional regulator